MHVYEYIRDIPVYHLRMVRYHALMGLDFYLYDYDESLREAALNSALDELSQPPPPEVMKLRKRRPSTSVPLATEAALEACDVTDWSPPESRKALHS